ncbi:hypothetical protein M422DRAFT_246134 [Sphaerobolus stellatus SS14]|nr:hypothetical protein M422DRAFT_246134 [Sphaerobolus stellatus SS14]
MRGRVNLDADTVNLGSFGSLPLHHPPRPAHRLLRLRRVLPQRRRHPRDLRGTEIPVELASDFLDRNKSIFRERLRVRLPIGRNGGHDLRPALLPRARCALPRRREHRRDHHLARDALRGAHQRGPGDRCRVDQGVYEPVYCVVDDGVAAFGG